MDSQVTSIVALLVAVLIFLVIRRFWLWYLNLSQILQVLRDLYEAQVATNVLLRALLEQLPPPPGPPAQA